MIRLLVILLFPVLTFGQTVNVKVFRTHAGNGNTSQYPNFANNKAQMDMITNTAYSNTTLWWSGTMNASVCLNFNNWGILSNAGASIPNNGDFYAVEVSGVFTPTETGVYTFGINSDDGSDLLINGTVVTSFYGGHGMSGYQYGSVSLVAGTSYTFMARMQEYGGGDGMAVVWKRPSQTTYSLQTAELGVIVPLATISGTVTVPTLTSYPTLSLYRIVGTTESLVETKTVATNGTYTFTVPANNTTYKIYPALSIQGITSADFSLVWGEVKNVNTPTNTASGLVMTGTKQWKAADVNNNGILDLGDVYLIAAHNTGLRSITQVLWFNAADYDLINKTNYPTITSVNSFTISVITSNVTQNIKYCILGDVNLSHSSN